MKLGKTFPDKPFQADFARHLAQVFQKTPWMISVDAADESRTPFAAERELMKLPLGVFDDSFLCRQHARVNSTTGISGAVTVGNAHRRGANSAITPGMTRNYPWPRMAPMESPSTRPRPIFTSRS